MNKYCDIIPHCDGWTYVLNGVEAGCTFHTYELALEAAKLQLLEEQRERVFRQKGVNGEMLPIGPPVFPQASFLN